MATVTHSRHEILFCQPYQYDELPRNGSFRYLILHPGAGSDPLECSLETALLSETTFEAISYVWGSNIKDKEIICDDFLLNITTNLSNALRRLRLADATRKLWADSICINQENLEEKSHQVAIMGEIYRAAKCVLIYIGPDDGGHGPLVCSLLDDVSLMINEILLGHDRSRHQFPWPRKSRALLSDPRWKSLRTLLSQDWFKRGWVVREVALAKYGIVIWHNSHFRWEKLMRSYTWVRRRGSQIYLGADLTLHSQIFRLREKAFVQLFYPKRKLPTQSLLSYLSTAKSLQLSNARDRIYAFMELSDGIEGVVTTNPNYNLSPLEVYLQFAVQYIQETKDIKILDHVCHDSNWESSDIPYIPSWVPRWDVCRWSIPGTALSQQQQTSPRDGSIREPEIFDHCFLSVRGVVTDSIQYVSEVFQARRIERRTMSELWFTISHMLNPSPYGTSGSLSAFLDSLSCGTRNGTWDHWVRCKAAFMAHIHAKHDRLVTGKFAHQGDPSPRDENDELYITTVMFSQLVTFMNGRRFVVTKRGYMGLAPEVTQRDDACGIIFGCMMPCILRETAQKQHYKFLGATCLMGSEASEQEGISHFSYPLGHDESKEWVGWDVEEQDIYLV